MPSSGLWQRVDLVRTYVSGECVASIFRVEKSVSEEKFFFFELWLSASQLQTLCLTREFLHPEDVGDTFLTRLTRRHIPEDGIPQVLLDDLKIRDGKNCHRFKFIST
jgi:hypothetical protein